MRIPCYWLEPTPRERRFLRRYHRDTQAPDHACAQAVPAHGYHQAMAPVEDGDVQTDAEGYGVTQPPEAYAGDPRWPAACACGRPFAEDDVRQVFTHRIYRRPDTGQLMTIDEAPPGAMWDAWWYGRHFKGPGPDGLHLMVKTPGGDWYVDGPAKNSETGWTRTGDTRAVPPTVSATPSIGIGDGKYHGWLRDGALVEA